MVRSFQYSLIQ